MPGSHKDETPSTVARPPQEVALRKDRSSSPQHPIIVGVLVGILLAGGVLVGYGVTQVRRGEQRQAALEIAKQREADQRKAQQQAEQSQAALQASQEATIAEGQLVSAQVVNLKALRDEFDSTMAAVNAKAKASSAASRSWDRIWTERLARYRSRTAAVRAHNYRERQRYYASKTERANSAGRLVVVYTYRPRYLGSPARPQKPAPLNVSVAPEIKRLAALRPQIDALRASVASQAPAARSFGSVYPVLDTTAEALRGDGGRRKPVAEEPRRQQSSQGQDHRHREALEGGPVRARRSLHRARPILLRRARGCETDSRAAATGDTVTP